MKKQAFWLVTAIAMGLPHLAQAQAKPADTASAAQPLRYQSAFSGYRPWQDIAPGDWRAINDSLRGTGGHTGHGSAAPVQANPAPSGAGPGHQAPAAGHGGHHMHGGRK